MRAASFLTKGPLPINDVCNIILEYGAEFEGRRKRELQFPWDVMVMAELPDGKIMMAGGDSAMMRVVDFESGECVHTLAGHTSPVFTLAVMPDGKLASGSLDKTVRVWDMNTLECMLTLPHASDVQCLTVMKDGLAAGLGDGTIQMWQ
jgi:WD40 repeat protein